MLVGLTMLYRLTITVYLLTKRIVTILMNKYIAYLIIASGLLIW